MAACNEIVKSKQLGMKLGTAQNRLRRLVMFDLVKRSGLDICYRCGKKIETVSELTIDHKKPWLHDDISLFWNLDNIAFSHLSCNCSCARRAGSVGGKPSPFRKVGREGTAWCFRCKVFHPVKEFTKDKTRWNNLDNQCKTCRYLYRK